MNTKAELNKLETCVKIVEGIRLFKRLIESQQESLDGFQGTFPELRRKLIHRIEIYQKCVQRLEQRYEKAVAGLYKIGDN
jgi:hypothetical protein